MEQQEQGQLSPEDKHIRKLRKKLREIERLELRDRELSEDEHIKVNSKGNIRKELRNLVKDPHPDEADLMKRQGFWLSPEDTGIDTKKVKGPVDVNSELADEQEQRKRSSASSQSAQHNDFLEGTPKTSRIKDAAATEGHDRGQSKVVKEKPAKSVWRDSSYEVFTLEGHNDIVLCVDCTEEYIISASRDTTVKVWRVSEAKEERGLRGHTAAVTAVTFLPEALAATVLKKYEEDPEVMPPVHRHKSAERRLLAVSGSLDCTIRIWDVQSGESFGSIYTYNGITVMKCGNWGAVTGTEGGKLEVWSIATGQRLAFVNAFQYKVTALHIDGDQIYAGSSEGDAGIWRYNPSTKSLSAVFIMEFESQSYVPLRSLSALLGRKEILYFGDNGPNIKVLDWKTGNVTRLVNHIGDIGMTDSLAISSDGHLLSSSYFVDTGVSSINVREVFSGQYVCSLIDKDEGRYLSMSSAPGVIVTGGHLLKVWLQGEKRTVPKKSKKQDTSEIIHPNVLRKLSSRAVESASEEDTDWASSSDDEDDGGPHNRMSGGPEDSSASGWWCNIL